MALWLASVHARGLRSKIRRARLANDLQCPGVDVYCLQKTQFSTRDYEYIPSKRFVFYSECFDGRSRGISWLAGKSLNAARALIIVDPAGKLCVMDVIIKDTQRIVTPSLIPT